MRIELNLSFEEIKMYKESLFDSIIVIGQKLNILNLKESLVKLKKIDKEIDKINKATSKGGVIHTAKLKEDAPLRATLYVKINDLNGAIL